MTARAALGVLLVAGVCAAPAAAWRYESECAGLIAVDAAGDVAAGGVHFDQFVTPSIAACKIDGTTGAELWSSLVDVGTHATISAIAMDANGHVIASAEHDGDFFAI